VPEFSFIKCDCKLENDIKDRWYNGVLIIILTISTFNMTTTVLVGLAIWTIAQTVVFDVVSMALKRSFRAIINPCDIWMNICGLSLAVVLVCDYLSSMTDSFSQETIDMFYMVSYWAIFALACSYLSFMNLKIRGTFSITLTVRLAKIFSIVSMVSFLASAILIVLDMHVSFLQIPHWSVVDASELGAAVLLMADISFIWIFIKQVLSIRSTFKSSTTDSTIVVAVFGLVATITHIVSFSLYIGYNFGENYMFFVVSRGLYVLVAFVTLSMKIVIILLSQRPASVQITFLVTDNTKDLLSPSKSGSYRSSTETNNIMTTAILV
jgi:hypothetical protein